MTARAVALIGGTLAGMLGLTSAMGAASDPIALQWQDLMPQEGRAGGSSDDSLRGVVQHGEMTPAPGTVDPSALVTEYNGERVRLPGYVLPLDFAGTSIQEFLLVPYVGACIHVPPPPPNQIVYVTIEEGIEVRGMFEPVWVTGTFDTASISNELADIGYRIEAELVEPYE